MKSRRRTAITIGIALLAVATIMWSLSKPAGVIVVTASLIGRSSDVDGHPGWELKVENPNNRAVTVECFPEVLIDGQWVPKPVPPYFYPRTVPQGADHFVFFIPDKWPGMRVRACFEVLRPVRFRRSFLDRFILIPLRRMYYKRTGDRNASPRLFTYVDIPAEATDQPAFTNAPSVIETLAR